MYIPRFLPPDKHLPECSRLQSCLWQSMEQYHTPLHAQVRTCSLTASEFGHYHFVRKGGLSNSINKAYLVVGALALLFLETRFRFIKLLYPSVVRDEDVGDERVLPTNEA